MIDWILPGPTTNGAPSTHTTEPAARAGGAVFAIA